MAGKQTSNKQTSSSLQNTTHSKTTDRLIRIPLVSGGELRYYGRVGSSCTTNGIRRVTRAVVTSHGRDCDYVKQNRHMMISKTCSMTFFAI